MDYNMKPRPWWWLPNSNWWSTWRWPWESRVTIYHPRGFRGTYSPVLPHELYHAREQWSKWWGPWLLPLLYSLLPLPILVSGRWWIERGAYLLDIQAGRLTIDQAVDTLWHDYLWPMPRFLMRGWFWTHCIVHITATDTAEFKDFGKIVWRRDNG